MPPRRSGVHLDPGSKAIPRTSPGLPGPAPGGAAATVPVEPAGGGAVEPTALRSSPALYRAVLPCSLERSELVHRPGAVGEIASHPHRTEVD
jgi:hypothetical protein